MNRQNYFLYLTALIIISFTNSFSQRVDYKSDSGVNIGFGIGASYQCSDIRNSIGEGFDFTFGSAIYQKENAFFSLDWRYRFLFGQNVAFDDRINIDSTYSNVKYTHINNDIEFILTLNRLRNSTGLTLSGFFGAGLAYNNTRFDIYDGFYSFSNTPYDYSVINPLGTDSREQIYQDLQVLSDDDFETQGISHFCLTPTLGLYLGYQFTRHFSIGIEHKSNFFLKESNYIDGANIDGVIRPDSRIDINNYTALIFRWDIGRASTTTYSPPVSNFTTVENVEVVTVPCNKPVVNINIKEINNSYYTHQLNGTISNIQSKNDISLKIDGKTVTNFTFNTNTNQISSSYILAPGNHNFSVIANNECGQDSKSFDILETQIEIPCLTPIINIVVNPINHHNSSHLLSGTILNVSDKNSITVTLDGKPDYNFTINPSTKQLSSYYTLTPGIHTIIVSAQNECGKESNTINVEVKEDVPPCYPPAIDITVNESNLNYASHELIGTILNVQKKSDIQITLDNIPDLKFTVDPITRQIFSNYQLSPGIHTLTVTAQNECGIDTETLNIEVKEPEAPCDPPVVNVRIREIEQNLVSHQISGTISNINNKNNISVTIDGQAFYSFQFNTVSKQFSSKHNLSLGLHTIVVSAQNECGNDSKTLTIRVDEPPPPPCDLPVINLLVNESNELNVSHKISGTITNIQNKNNISIKVDGRPHLRFTFNTISGQLSSKFNFTPGTHNILVTAQNECGNDSKTLTIRVEEPPPPPCDPPVVIVSINEQQISSRNSFMLSGTVSNITDKRNISVKIDGRSDYTFRFNAATKQITANYNLNPGVHNIIVSAQNECGKDSKTLRVEVDEPPPPPCDPPLVNIRLKELEQKLLIHQINGTISNINNKNNISVTIDGQAFYSFQFNTVTKQFSSKHNLAPGTHTIVVSAQNECGNDSKTLTIKVDEPPPPPCDPPVVNVSIIEQNNTYNLTGTITNINSKNNITVKIDGATDNTFSFNNITKQINANYTLNPGTHTIIVSAQNNCGSDSKTLRVNVEEIACGPRFNPGNDDWQFCLVTPSGTFNRSHLTNTNFTYTGNASSIYFKPIAGGGDAIVNGNPYTLNNGQYYLFTGNLKVTVSSTNPGNMGHWSVCLESNNIPQFGNGNNRPVSPCEVSNENNNGNNRINNQRGNNSNTNGNSNSGGNNVRNPSNTNRPR